MELDVQDWKFANRHSLALINTCKFCLHCAKTSVLFDLVTIRDKKRDIADTAELVVHARNLCPNFEDHTPVERDTTYPGATFAPHDKHDNLLDDSTDLYHNPHEAKRCINQMQEDKTTIKHNNWDKCLSQLFDRKRTVVFPDNTKIMELLNTSFIPQYTFRLGLPPQKGMGFSRGLWFYRSEKFNSDLDKNAGIKDEMKKLIMVYLYHEWFSRLDVPAIPKESKEVHAIRVEHLKLGIFMALDSSDPYSLSKDLAWWLTKVFKDKIALEVYPIEDEIQIEFVPMTLLQKAEEAAMIADAECEDMEELDIHVQEYEHLIAKYGYGST